MTAGSNQEIQRRITDDNNGQYQQQNMDHSTGNTGANYTHAASESVVPDLMEVYDALTMSSTPQPGGMYPPSASYGNEHQGRQEYYGGQQILPPALPSNTRQHYRRSVKSGGSSDESYSDTTTGSKRKATGGNSKSSRSRKGKEDPKKKSTANDSRWSKRFTWPDELHRDFVAAVFEVGLKHSSPSSIMEHMKQNPEVTSERVKSHLQKYRLNRQKSRNEFMTSYDRALDGFKKNPHDFDDDGDHSFSCGEGAAMLTHSIQTEGTREGSQSSRCDNKGLLEQAPVQTQGGTSAQDHDGMATLHLRKFSL
jgi:SHAQKYF class myb-like DNA-binding protein